MTHVRRTLKLAARDKLLSATDAASRVYVDRATPISDGAGGSFPFLNVLANTEEVLQETFDGLRRDIALSIELHVRDALDPGEKLDRLCEQVELAIGDSLAPANRITLASTEVAEPVYDSDAAYLYAEIVYLVTIYTANDNPSEAI